MSAEGSSAADSASDDVDMDIGFSGKAALAAAVAALAIGLTVTWIGRIPSGEDTLETWTYLLLAFVGGVALFVAGFGEYHRRNLVANTPTSKVRSISMGTVELEGRAKPGGGVVQAPITGTDCVLYRYEVEEYRHSGDDSRWVTLDSGREFPRFHLDDGTGEVLVDPDGADLRLPQDTRIETDAVDELPEPAREFVRENDEVDVPDGGFFDEDQRFTEWRVEVGDTVYVFGEAMPRDGDASTVNPENAVVNEDRSTPMFVISDRSESDLLSSMTWRAVGMVAGGFLLAVGGFAALVWYVGLL